MVAKKRASFYKLKKEIYDHYGNKCQCCGEKRKEFLSIDHMDGGGHKHRKEIGGNGLYYWLRQKKFPKNFRILCMNCNWAIGVYGYCPHKNE